MDFREEFRLAIIVSGMLLADGRRTARYWSVAAGVQDDWERVYDCVIHIGKRSGTLGLIVLGLFLQKLTPDLAGYVVVVLDDFLTKRYDS